MNLALTSASDEEGERSVTKKRTIFPCIQYGPRPLYLLENLLHPKLFSGALKSSCIFQLNQLYHLTDVCYNWNSYIQLCALRLNALTKKSRNEALTINAIIQVVHSLHGENISLQPYRASPYGSSGRTEPFGCTRPLYDNQEWRHDGCTRDQGWPEVDYCVVLARAHPIHYD